MSPNPQEMDLVTFTEEMLNEKLHFLRSDGFLLIWEKWDNVLHWSTNASFLNKNDHFKTFST